MNLEQKYLCLQAIFALAWLDDFHEQEREYLQGLVEHMGIEPAERARVMMWMNEAPPSPDWDEIARQPELGELILEQAIYLSMLDMSVTAKELSFLQRLRAKLGLEEMAFYRIQKDVEQSLFSEQQ